MKNYEYLNEQKETIFNEKQWATFKVNYNQVKMQEKNKVGFATMVTNLVCKMLDSKRVTNENINDLISLANYLLNIEKYNKFCELVKNGLDFKKSVVEILNKTQKVGVIASKTDTEKTQKIGFKMARGERVLRDLFLLLLSDTYMTKIEKKDKAKKTIKK